MDVLVLGSGMMGQAIAYDLIKYSNFKNITLSDNNQKQLDKTKKFL